MIEIVCWIEGLPVSKEEEEEEECARGIQVEFRLRESVLFFLVPQREREREREREERDEIAHFLRRLAFSGERRDATNR